ncbi:MAG: hypothetical protein IJB68_05670 [Ruminococcus sp.]|nr:hypothetical protein [Ruminococcus sp.]
MKEYGGYIELDTYRLPMLHNGAKALNCGRNCLAYLIKARNIKKLLIPYFMCDSVFDLCRKYSVELRFYHINEKFMPEQIQLEDDEWLYVMNYYGQLTQDYLCGLKKEYDRVIIDNAQAYFEEPIENTDTLYTCRKFFGVADGAFLYTDVNLNEDIPLDESFDRMHFLLGRYERSASEFYSEYSMNNHMFADEPIKQMSKLTENLLHGIDYTYVKQRRTQNFKAYNEMLGNINQLELREAEGAFAYPLMVSNGAALRKALQQKKIYIPTLWPNLLNETETDSTEYRMVDNILPLPCDQRYDINDIKYIADTICELSEDK